MGSDFEFSSRLCDLCHFLCLFFEVTALSDRKGKFSAWSAFQFLSDLEDHVFFTGLFKVRITNRLASVCVSVCLQILYP